MHRFAVIAVMAFLALSAPSPGAAAGASSADEAAQVVKAKTGGQILGVKRQGGRYLVKVLTGNGRVRVVAVPAR